MPVNKNLNLGSFIDKQIFNGLGGFTEFFQLFVKFRLLAWQQNIAEKLQKIVCLTVKINFMIPNNSTKQVVFIIRGKHLSFM